MMYMLLFWLILLLVSACYATNENHEVIYNMDVGTNRIDLETSKEFLEELSGIPLEKKLFSETNPVLLSQIKQILGKNNTNLRPEIIETTSIILQCAMEAHKKFNEKLIIIDYSIPSSEKRLWMFDLEKQQLLFHTYVSHGIRSGSLYTTYFSNKNGSKSSSLGVFFTDKVYRGRHGLSLKLSGLERGFNDNAMARYIVMHSAWYVNEDFVNKYGRIGRSWGCPAIPIKLIKPFIDAVSEHSLVIIYYPGEKWLNQSKFLNCPHTSAMNQPREYVSLPDTPVVDNRSEILFVDKNNNNQREEHEPIIIVSANNYKQLFKADPPLTRMLRRQFKDTEYIALNLTELKQLDANFDGTINAADQNLTNLDFVIPVVKNIRGYYATEFKSESLGDIKEIKFLENKYLITTDKASLHLRASESFIRWLGL